MKPAVVHPHAAHTADPPPLAVDIIKAARLAGCCPDMLRAAVRAGELLVVRYGRAVRFRLVDLDDFLRRKAGSDRPAIIAKEIEHGR